MSVMLWDVSEEMYQGSLHSLQNTKEEFCCLRCNTVSTNGSTPTFWRSIEHSVLSASCLFLASLTLYPWRWKWYSSETSVDFHWTTRRYISEDRTLHSYCCENLQSSLKIQIHVVVCYVNIMDVEGHLWWIYSRRLIDMRNYKFLER
jgi:hypothetical protein